MKRIEFSSPGSLVLAAVAVTAVAIWAVAAHSPCHQCHSPAADSAGLVVAAMSTASDPSSAIATGSAGPAHTASVEKICPPCDACPEMVGNPAASHTGTPASAGLNREGMVVAIDPETGLLGAPTATQAADLQTKSLDPADAMQGLEEIHHADGSVSVKDLTGRFLQWEIVRVGPDGAVQASSVQGIDQAEAAVRDVVTPVVNAVEVK